MHSPPQNQFFEQLQQLKLLEMDIFWWQKYTVSCLIHNLGYNQLHWL